MLCDLCHVSSERVSGQMGLGTSPTPSKLVGTLRLQSCDVQVWSCISLHSAECFVGAVWTDLDLAAVSLSLARQRWVAGSLCECR